MCDYNIAHELSAVGTVELGRIILCKRLFKAKNLIDWPLAKVQNACLGKADWSGQAKFEIQHPNTTSLP
jgi:hypothetical protein